MLISLALMALGVVPTGVGAAPTAGQPLGDVNAAGLGSSPRQFTAAGALMYFLADDGVHGTELWRTDGAGASTLVADLSPGVTSTSIQTMVAGPDGLLYFAARVASESSELFVTDGTAAGTRRLPSSLPYTCSYCFLEAGAEAVYMVAQPVTTPSVNGHRLWRATASGVELIGTPAGDFSIVGQPRLVGRYVYFPGYTLATGQELWRTDLTASTTALVADIEPGPFGSYPSSLTRVGDEVFFQAGTTATGDELWKSDGTTGGTVIVRDIAPLRDDSSPYQLTAAAGRLFFITRAPTAVWSTDGTPLGTIQVDSGRWVNAIAPLGDARAMFSTADGLWTSDGTPDGTRFVRPLTNARSMTPFGDRVFLLGDDGSTGVEPWISDGTEAGTSLLADVVEGPEDSSGTDVGVLGDRAFFAGGGYQRTEVWSTDGTAAATRLHADIRPGTESSAPADWIGLGTTIYFSARGGSVGRELFMLDGASRPQLVRDISLGSRSSDPHDFATAGKRLFFIADDGVHGRELWTAGGSTAGARLLRDIYPGGGYSGYEPRQLTALGGAVFFVAGSGENGVELWRTDGTEAGTALFADVAPGRSSSDPRDLTVAGRFLYFTAMEWTESGQWAGRALWRTDGTPSGLVRLAGGGEGQITFAERMTAVGSTLFFSGTSTQGTELWKSDGTPEGTVLVKDIDPRPQPPGSALPPSSHPSNLTAVGSLLYFMASSPEHGRELWRSDGSSEGTWMVADMTPGTEYPWVRLFTGAGSSLFFLKSTAATGEELWRSDGTAAGTGMVTDIKPGPASSTGWASSLVAGRGTTVYFAADDGRSGSELWKSDGTASGTTMVADVNPGPPSGLGKSDVPEGATRMAAVGNRLLFGGDNGMLGHEPMALRL